MGPSDLFVSKALRVRGRTEEKGMAIVRPEYVVFAPLRPNAAAPGGVAGYDARVMPQAFHDVPSYVRYLARLAPADFDATLNEAVRHAGWSRVALGEVKVVRKKALLRRHRVSFAFETARDAIHLDGPVDPSSLPDVDTLLARWLA